MRRSERFDPANAPYAQLVYEQWLRDPASVDESWRRVFGPSAADLGLITPAGEVAAAPAGAPLAVTTRPADPSEIRAAKAAAELIEMYRLNGHFAAQLDPLGSPPRGHPTLEPEFHGIAAEELESGAVADVVGSVLEWLRAIYTGPIGFEFQHVQDPDREEWLRAKIEAGDLMRPLASEQRRRLLERLTEVEAFEQFLHRAYLGAKRFSIEGTDMLVPMLDLSIERAAGAGAREVVLGMAHRGRLNVLVHVLGKPYQKMFAGFEGRHAGLGTTGDVKYHLGAEGTYATASGEPLTVTLAPNPSHLEAVDPVVEGIARAKQSARDGAELRRDDSTVLPILIHGDAAFAAQGVIAETLNLAGLDGYRTGGTLHIIVNNQIGFTTLPSQARSTLYASDLAHGFDIPVFHVNADDPEACLAVARLAMMYRETFHADVVIDLIGYRRYGHNEGDEPAYTQPQMYDAIRDHPTVRTLWAKRLAEEGVVTDAEAQQIWDGVYERMVEAQQEVRSAEYTPVDIEPEEPSLEPSLGAQTAVPEARLRELDHALHRWPDSLLVNPKLARQLERRSQVFDEDGPIDWAHAEALAFASLLVDGTPVRLTGQDTERGTFSQRHLVLHDARTGERYVPLSHLPQQRAPFEIHNSPLSELACVGFEYGYSIAAPETLVLWEAQFGDFINGAQIIVDQFMAAGRAKWGQQSRLVLLLPHGYEGQGPEHSSARLERFLQLAAEDNIRVANCSTPAQYFHLLRRQAKLKELRPLIVMTPKSLLRHPKAVSARGELADGAFQFVISDATSAERKAATRRLLLCTGKIYYDLEASDARDAAEHVAIARVEQLYPFPAETLGALLAALPALEELVWVQEEPANMGAWRSVEPRLRRLASSLGHDIPLHYVGRPDRASPAEGYANLHEREQARIIAEALGMAQPAAREPRTG
ncbi:MAG: 2-oxoglutarate dehydrogenase E1 component [Longimicrobiales bacterium]